MPTPTKGRRIGGSPSHERLILSNMATSLFENDRITTTAAKAKRLRPLAERMVTFAKRGDLHARRQVMTVIRDKGAVHRLFTEIAPDMANREGGYTRTTKIGNRKGDNAPMVVIELVRERLSPKQATVAEAEATVKRAAADDKPAASDDGTVVAGAEQPTPDADDVTTETVALQEPGTDDEATEKAAEKAKADDARVADAKIDDAKADNAEAEDAGQSKDS